LPAPAGIAGCRKAASMELVRTWWKPIPWAASQSDGE